eukprot:scaffold16113_cov20-Tisochrysis_lutea.AAC.4
MRHAEDGSAVGGLFAQLPPDTQAIVRPFLYSKYVVQDIASKHAQAQPGGAAPDAAAGTGSGGAPNPTTSNANNGGGGSGAA